jgi:hypothetical protein
MNALHVAMTTISQSGQSNMGSGNRVSGFTTYPKTDGSNGWAADVGLGYEQTGWKSSVSGNLVKMTQSGGLVYGLAMNESDWRDVA